MATLISCATGNFTAAATWELVDATSHLDSETGSTEVATAPAWGASSTFTPGAITVDGIAIKVYSRAASPTGTFSVCIGQAGSPVAGTTVTINATDIPYAVTAGYGWMFFKFAAPVTLLGATAYTVMCQESVAADDVTLYRDSTASNWSRCLRTTTTQAPAAGDKLYVMGEWTAAATSTVITVTMNNNDATDYGTGSITLPSLAVCSKGVLDWAYAATTQLRLSGILAVYAGGTVNIGTVANPIGAAYTALLEFDCAAAGDFGLIKYSGGVVVMQGNALSYDRAYLASDEAVGQTVFETDVATGWKSGDRIVISSTTRTYSEYELRVLDGDAAGTTVTVTAGLTYTHSGTAPTRAEIIHLDRNVTITAVNASYNAYMRFYGVSAIGSVDIDWVEISEMGGNTADKYGFELNSSTETIVVQRCSFYSCYQAFRFTNSAGYGNNFTWDNNVSHPADTGGGAHVFIQSATAGVNYSLSGNWIIGCSVTTENYFQVGDVRGTIDNNVLASCNVFSYTLGANQIIGSFSGNVAHSNAKGGFQNYASVRGTITNMVSYLNAGDGYRFVTGTTSHLTFVNPVMFGNTGNNFGATITGAAKIVVSGGALNGYSGFATSYGIRVSTHYLEALFDGTAIGVASGSKTDHTSAEIYVGAFGCAHLRFHNCTWGAATRVSMVLDAANKNIIGFSKDGGTENNDFTYVNYGILTHNASEGIGATDCLELQPTGNADFLDLSSYLDFGMFQCPAQDGVARTVYIQLKDNVAWDGTEVSIALYQNGVLVDGWDDKIGTITTDYTEYSLTYTPTEDGVLDLAIRLDGDAGRVYADGFRWT